MAAYRTTDTHVYFLGGYFSQWAPSPFKGAVPYIGQNSSGPILLPYLENIKFSSCEQYMMAAKASVFEDGETLNYIMLTSDPKEQKELGRAVSNFDKTIWETYARQIVSIGNFYKFTQCEPAREFLNLAEDRIIVEGASYDPIWGVGISWQDPLIEDHANWKGTNWLGEAIMWARTQIHANPGLTDPWALRVVWP
jgi:ribA/ribD-fused uncharacterized protein